MSCISHGKFASFHARGCKNSAIQQCCRLSAHTFSKCLRSNQSICVQLRKGFERGTETTQNHRYRSVSLLDGQRLFPPCGMYGKEGGNQHVRVVQTAGRREKSLCRHEKRKRFLHVRVQGSQPDPTCKVYARQIGDENVGQTAKV